MSLKNFIYKIFLKRMYKLKFKIKMIKIKIMMNFIKSQ